MVNSTSFHRYSVRNLVFLNKLSGENKNIYLTLENHKTSYEYFTVVTCHIILGIFICS